MYIIFFWICTVFHQVQCTPIPLNIRIRYSVVYSDEGNMEFHNLFWVKSSLPKMNLGLVLTTDEKGKIYKRHQTTNEEPWPGI